MVALREHVKKVGGELIEVLGEKTNEVVRSATPQEPKSGSIDYDTIRALVSSPEVLPCAFDNSLGFWLDRIELWGKLIITRYPPHGGAEKINTCSKICCQGFLFGVK